MADDKKLNAVAGGVAPPEQELSELEKLLLLAEEEPPVEEGIGIFAMLAEAAYTRMYESSHPKDERDDALYQLKMALRIARALKLTEKAAALQKRYEEIETVFNSQFRR